MTRKRKGSEFFKETIEPAGLDVHQNWWDQRRTSNSVLKSLREWETRANLVLEAHGYQGSYESHGASLSRFYRLYQYDREEMPVSARNARDVLERIADVLKFLGGSEPWNLAEAAFSLGLAVARADIENKMLERRSNGGKESGKTAADQLCVEYSNVDNAAVELRAAGKTDPDVTRILAERFKRSRKQMRRILREKGFLPPAKKRT